MMLLRLISWPYFRKHILRTLLTTAGIVLGVAVFVGMHTANQSVLFAFNHTVDQIAGKTELQITAGETGFNEEVLETVQGAATVAVAVPGSVVVNHWSDKSATATGWTLPASVTPRTSAVGSGSSAVATGPGPSRSGIPTLMARSSPVDATGPGAPPREPSVTG